MPSAVSHECGTVLTYPVADIESITWFPYDNPDELPPNTDITACDLTVKNVGNGAGNIYIKIYTAIVGETDWQLYNSANVYLEPNETASFSVIVTTPSSGTLHIAVVVFSEAEDEPSLPPADVCP